MGRITIFTNTHCLFSLQVKHELTKRRLPFSEVNLSDYPEKQSDLFLLTRRMTTPQAFFNTRYVGGCDATLQLLEEWDQDKQFKSPLDKYKAQIARFPDPSNPHLALPQSLADMEETSSSESSSVVALPIDSPTVTLQLPDNPSKTYAVRDLIDELSEVLPLATLSYHLTNYKNSVTGSQATTGLMKHFQTETREEAEAIGQQLHELNIIHHVCNDHGYQDTTGLYYRLQAHQTPHILNSLYLVSENDMHWDNARAEALVERMETVVRRLERACYAVQDGGGIRYSKGKDTAHYRELEEGICLFQAVEFDTMKPKELLAWGLNVYNIMLKFALFKHGIPKTKGSAQQTFLRETQFNVGGKLYSFIDWIGAITAGKVGVNGPAPVRRKSIDPATKTGRRFSSIKKSWSFDESPINGFKRVSMASARRGSKINTGLASPSDYRVHFATHFLWARASAVPHFTAQNLDKELNMMALAFCAEDSNVKVDTRRGELILSNVFSIFRSDFCTSSTTFASELSDSITSSTTSCDKDLTNIVFSFLESPKKLQLQQLLYSGSKTKLQITFHPDDWTLNAFGKDYDVFNASSIDGNTSRI